jgi:shikimate 5-dehydrogenase
MSALDRVSIQSRSIAFFGCGGVSTAVALANAQGLERVGLYDIAENKSVALRERILSLNPEVDVSIVPAEPRRDLRGYDVLYNGTGLGKFPHLSDSPLAENDLLDASLFIDAIYTPSETTFLSRGRVAGARAVNGLSHMLASTAFHCSVIGGVEIDVSEVEAAHRSLFEPA